MRRIMVTFLLLIAYSYLYAPENPKDVMYIALDGDNIGSKVEIAALSNDPKQTYAISKQIRDISAATTEFVNDLSNNNAEIILFGGDSLSFILDKKLLNQVDLIRQFYNEKSGFTVTIGIGDTVAQASRALLYGKLTGKNKTVLWQPTIDTQLKNLVKKETEEQKVTGILQKAKFA